MAGINRVPNDLETTPKTVEAAYSSALESAIAEQTALLDPERIQHIDNELKDAGISGVGDTLRPNVNPRANMRFYFNLHKGRYKKGMERFITNACAEVYKPKTIIDEITYTPEKSKWRKVISGKGTELDINRRAQVLLLAACADDALPLATRLNTAYSEKKAHGLKESIISPGHLTKVFKKFPSPVKFVAHMDEYLSALAASHNTPEKIKEYADAKFLLARALYKDGYAYLLRYLKMNADAEKLAKAGAFSDLVYDSRASNGIPETPVQPARAPAAKAETQASKPPTPDDAFIKKEAQIVHRINELAKGDYMQAINTLEEILDVYAKGLIDNAGSDMDAVAQIGEKVESARSWFTTHHAHLFGPLEAEIVEDGD